jgi:5-methylcytosine-specific restriction endonuclease McrA
MSGLRKKVYKRTDPKECCYCRVPLTLDECTVEHIIPRAYGGTDRAQNTALACRLCNVARGDSFDLAKIKKNRDKMIRRQGLKVNELDPHWGVLKTWESWKRSVR